MEKDCYPGNRSVKVLFKESKEREKIAVNAI